MVLTNPCTLTCQFLYPPHPCPTLLRYFWSSCDRDPPAENFKNSRFVLKCLQILNVDFWVENVYFWEDNVYFWGSTVYFWKILGFWNFLFCCWGAWGLCGSGGPVEVFKNIYLGLTKGWFPKGWFWRMFARNENQNEGTFACSPERKPERGYVRMFPWNKNWNEGTFACSPGTKTGTRARSPKPPFYETARLSPSESIRVSQTCLGANVPSGLVPNTFFRLIFGHSWGLEYGEGGAPGPVPLHNLRVTSHVLHWDVPLGWYQMPSFWITFVHS